MLNVQKMSDAVKNVKLDESKGSFGYYLKRNNKQIKSDRAEAIIEDAELVYRREIEDMQMTMKRLVRKRENMLDLSPTNSQSLMLAEDFDAKGFVNLDLDLAVQIRNLEIKIELGVTRFKELFNTSL